MIRDKYEDAAKDGSRLVEFPTGPGANSAENALFNLEQRDSLTVVDPLEEWAKALTFPPNPRIDDLVGKAKVMVVAKGPKDLQRQLTGIHGNRVLACLNLRDPKEGISYAATCDSLLGGPYPTSDFGETVESNLIVTDPGDLLSEVVARARTDALWLRQTIWLVDGDLGPDAVEFAPREGGIHVSDGSTRFGEALTAALAKRLNNHDPGTIVHSFNLAETQIRWIDFLKEMDGRLPGISGAARGLLATLAFGLIELGNARGCQPLSVTPEGVEALGGWIVERMANSRLAMMRTAEQVRKTKLALRILWKLSEGQYSRRDLCRTFTITAACVEEIFAVLEPAGLVRQIDGSWERHSQNPVLEADLETLFLGT